MLDDINVNATFKKYRSIEYNGKNYNAKKRLIVYAMHLTDLRNISSNLKNHAHCLSSILQYMECPHQMGLSISTCLP